VGLLPCAISGAVLALVLAAAGCQSDVDPDPGLNPRPEDFPSANAPGPASPEASIERETCDDNPLLAGCEPPQDLGPVTDGNGKPLPEAPSGSIGAGQDAGPNVDATLGLDAGALRASDAGAP
jgi:hypothetical protein